MNRFTAFVIVFILFGPLNISPTITAKAHCLTTSCSHGQISPQQVPAFTLATRPNLTLAATSSQTLTVTSSLLSPVTSSQILTVTMVVPDTTNAAQVARINGLYELFKASVWPLTLIFLIFIVGVNWQKIADLFTIIAPRISKVSFGEFLTVDLTPVSQPPSALLSDNAVTELQKPIAPGNVHSGLLYLNHILNDKNIQRLDYIIVDLGSGEEWLTSRLFLFAVVLKRTKKLRSIVFLYTENHIQGTGSKKFLGIASADQVSSTLALEYPALEQAYFEALSEKIEEVLTNNPLLYDRDISNPDALDDLTETILPVAAQRFLELIQVDAANAPATQSEWVTTRDNPNKVELCHWISSETFESHLWSDILNVDDVYTSKEFRDMSEIQKQKSILRCEGPFVAIVNRNGKFKDLYDRQALAERIISQQAKPSDN